MTTLTLTSTDAFPRKTALYVGRVLSGLAVGALAFDAAIKLTDLFGVPQTAAPAGCPGDLAQPAGLAEIACIGLYLAPRTANFGAAAITLLYGAAMLNRMASSEPMAAHLVFGAYLAALVWGGLRLRRA
ncbi:MAG TPA: DoxX family protein [Caulobacteraceae bacterium]